MLPVIFGLAGASLSREEESLFRQFPPAGYILFRRNVASPAQVQALTGRLQGLHPGRKAPILIDQEGGRVQRMGPPFWPAFPALSLYGNMWQDNPSKALQQCYQDQYRLARGLAACGITVNCTPVLDVPAPGGHPIIGDRAFSSSPDAIAALGAMVIKAHLDAGVTPVIKHIPGHGRAPADSHETLPVVHETAAALLAYDVRPFQALRHAPWAMTAHVLYPAWDSKRPASASPDIIRTVIRSHAGFEGILVSDDLTMKALRGAMPERAEACLSAGCDLVLHCSGNLAEMTALSHTLSHAAATLETRLQHSLQTEGSVPWA
jgi:beta-N-acetylhexosaminidase